MSRRQTFRVRLLRPLRFGARAALAGAELELDAPTAAGLVRELRAVLVEPADLAALAQLAPRVDAAPAAR